MEIIPVTEVGSMFLITRYYQVVAVTRSIEENVEIIQRIRNNKISEYSNLPQRDYRRRNAGGVQSYLVGEFSGIKIYEIPSDSWVDVQRLNNLPSDYSQMSDVTGDYFLIEETMFEGNIKLFATVTKQGLKSSNMEVIVDPALSGDTLRPISYYQDLAGTFAFVKASVHINSEYGYAHLRLSPDSLGNYRVESQQVRGSRVTFSGDNEGEI